MFHDWIPIILLCGQPTERNTSEQEAASVAGDGSQAIEMVSAWQFLWEEQEQKDWRARQATEGFEPSQEVQAINRTSSQLETLRK